MVKRLGISVSRRNGYMHLEAPGCIVNIYPHLRNVKGQEVTTVAISSDEDWETPDHGDGRGVSVRVVKVRPPLAKPLDKTG